LHTVLTSDNILGAADVGGARNTYMRDDIYIYSIILGISKGKRNHMKKLRILKLIFGKEDMWGCQGRETSGGVL
jgi:hypothetical protein